MCKIGKLSNKRTISGLCSECNSIMTSNFRKDSFCQKCNSITPHNGRMCLICNPSSISGSVSLFTFKNGIRYYKDKPLKELCDKLLSGEDDIKNYPGFEIRNNRICYNRIDVLTDEKILMISKFEIKNNILYYYDKNINNYIPWNKYKEKFINFYKDTNFQLPEGFKIYPTFRTQDSDSWAGARQAFEQSLVDEEISWFTYIKFYIDNDGNNKLFVVGKSGSLLVNNNGSDISFSTNIEDAPARRFIKDINAFWNKTLIAICKTNSEVEALSIEKDIAEKYKLFYS